MFLRRNRQAKRSAAVGLDLGSRQIKAAFLQREDQVLKLASYAVVTSAVKREAAGSVEQFAAELQQIMNSLGVQDRRVCASISCPSAMVCEAEFPRIPIEEVTSTLRLPGNSVRYLRRDLSNFYLDAVELPDAADAGKGKKSQTMRVLVAAADKQEVRWCRTALEAAKIRPEAIELSALTVINAFQSGNAELCEKEVLLLLDIGARSTSINFLRQGQPKMTRIMRFGGQEIQDFLGQMLSLPPGAAEEEVVKMSDAVQPLVRQALSPLAREVRSSIDFFERQQECHITRAFACGGAACSTSILGFLSEEVGFLIEPWDPVKFLTTAHLNGGTAALTNLAPSLAAAIGAAVPRVCG